MTISYGYFKTVFSTERVKSLFSLTFNIIMRHIFPENFIKIPSEDMNIFFLNIN